MVDPAVAAKAGPEGLTKLHQIIDHGQPIAFETIGANVGYFKPWNGSGSKQASLTYQLQFRDAWVVAYIVIESNDQGRHVLSAYFQPAPDSLQVLNAFTFKNKSVLHYLFLVLCILIPIFIISTTVVCIRSRVRRRWLWILFILFGFVQLRLNWTTGAWDVVPASFHLLGAAWFRASSYAPVIVSFSIPVGAIIFLALRRHLRRKEEPPPLPPAPTELPADSR